MPREGEAWGPPLRPRRLSPASAHGGARTALAARVRGQLRQLASGAAWFADDVAHPLGRCPSGRPVRRSGMAFRHLLRVPGLRRGPSGCTCADRSRGMLRAEAMRTHGALRHAHGEPGPCLPSRWVGHATGAVGSRLTVRDAGTPTMVHPSNPERRTTSTTDPRVGLRHRRPSAFVGVAEPLQSRLQTLGTVGRESSRT